MVTSLIAGRDGVVRGSSVHSEVAAYFDLFQSSGCEKRIIVG